MKKFIPVLLVSLLIMSLPVFSQQMQANSNDFLAQGLEAYKNGNWESAILLLKNAASLPDSSTPEVWYMLVMSEMFNGDYDAVLEDGKTFVKLFPKSDYKVYVDYQMGRALHYKGEYVKSIELLQKFCENNKDNELFSSALFWMAESFYAAYYFDEAKGLYERIVCDFPSSAKYTEALYRLDLITQREKEEKLLYLLKVTGEEYLSSRENYDRQIQRYNTEEAIGLRNQLRSAKEDLKKAEAELEVIKEEKLALENKYAELNNQYTVTKTELAKYEEKKAQSQAKYMEDLEALKKKAMVVQQKVDEQKMADDAALQRKAAKQAAAENKTTENKPVKTEQKKSEVEKPELPKVESSVPKKEVIPAPPAKKVIPQIAVGEPKIEKKKSKRSITNYLKENNNGSQISPAREKIKEAEKRTFDDGSLEYLFYSADNHVIKIFHMEDKFCVVDLKLDPEENELNMFKEKDKEYRAKCNEIRYYFQKNKSSAETKKGDK